MVKKALYIFSVLENNEHRNEYCKNCESTSTAGIEKFFDSVKNEGVEKNTHDRAERYVFCKSHDDYEHCDEDEEDDGVTHKN